MDKPYKVEQVVIAFAIAGLLVACLFAIFPKQAPPAIKPIECPKKTHHVRQLVAESSPGTAQS